MPARSRRSIAIVVALTAVAAPAAVLPAQWWVLAVAAQETQRLVINVASVTQAEPASRIRLPIQVGPQDALGKNSFIRIRGLPPVAALSAGYATGPRAWAVPLVALPSLSIILPVGIQGTSEVVISLVSVEGAVLAEARTMLVVAPAGTPPVRQEALPSAPPPAPKLSPADLHANGEEQLKRGNVYAARKFFERAAEAGLAQSAVAVAATYDPDELAKLKILGLQPDIEAARKWYEKARQLGAAEASERLRRLSAR